MTTSAINHKCEYCGQLQHPGICPTVKAIEYFENGMVKRVEFKTAADYTFPVAYPAQPAPPSQPFYPSWPQTTWSSASGPVDAFSR